MSEEFATRVVFMAGALAAGLVRMVSILGRRAQVEPDTNLLRTLGYWLEDGSLGFEEVDTESVEQVMVAQAELVSAAKESGSATMVPVSAAESSAK